MNTEDPLPSPQAMTAAKAGNIIEAIKLVREETGLGLKEAKELVENSMGAGDYPGKPSTDDEIPTGTLIALQRGQLIEAIRSYREHHQVGLKDAKEAVEDYLERNPLARRQFKAAVSRRRRPVVRVFWFLLIAGLAVGGYVLTNG